VGLERCAAARRNRKCLRHVGVAIDVTEKEVLELQLPAAQRYETAWELWRRHAHDLNHVLRQSSWCAAASYEAP